MRAACLLPAAAASVAFSVAPAHADTALGVFGQAGRYLGRAEGGWGPYAEISTGDRVAYFAEAALTYLHSGDGPEKRTGYFLRGGAGVRWRAREFHLDSSASIDMNLEAFAGLGDLAWNDGERVLRPDLGGGVGYQLRKRTGWGRGAAFRVTARVYFAPHDRSSAPEAACRGTSCPTSEPAGSSSGLLALFGVSW